MYVFLCLYVCLRARTHVQTDTQTYPYVDNGRQFAFRKQFFFNFLALSIFSEILSPAFSPLLVKGGKVGMDGYAVV